MLLLVYPTCPPPNSGLKPCHLITHLDINLIIDRHEYITYVPTLTPNSELSITYLRSDNTQTVTAILGTRPTAK